MRRERQLPGVLHRLMDELFPGTPIRDDQPRFEPFHRLIEQVRRSPQNAWDFHELARCEAVSYSLLRLRCKEITGLPPRQFLLRERVNLACRYLGQGASVKEAGFRVGIQDPYYFSRLFKRITGIAPREYLHPMR